MRFFITFRMTIYHITFHMSVFHKIRDYRISKKYFNNMNWIEVKRDAIIHNFLHHQNHRPWSLIIPVLKSNAYGHGLKQLCQILHKVPQCTMVAVDSYPEYLSVYHNCKKDILLLNETEHRNYKYFDHKRVIPWIYTLDTLQILIRSKKPRRIHLFLNTGMNREWFQLDELQQALSMLQWSRIIVDGVMSHFSHADDDDGQSYCDNQVAKFKEMYALVEQAWFHSQYRHINNSSWFVKNNDHRFNAHRIWKWLYGFMEYWNTEYAAFGQWLQYAIDVYSTVIWLQHIKAWEWAWYSHTWHAVQNTTIATIPFGYYEWLTRRMSNKWSVLLDEQKCNLVGNISMNICSFEDPTWKVLIWDVVKIISSDIDDANNWLTMSKINDTISREVLVKVHNMIRRKIV